MYNCIQLYKKMVSYNSDNTNEPAGLAFDLRQIYARLVGEHMARICDFRNESKYYDWLEAIENLKVISSFKFKDPEQDEKDYNEKKKQVISLSNKYRNSWNKTNEKSEEVWEIKKALRELEELLLKKMDGGGMFGTTGYYDEDEI